MMSKVLISGGTGLVGRQLSMSLMEKNFEVALLSRTKNLNNEVFSYHWDVHINNNHCSGCLLSLSPPVSRLSAEAGTRTLLTAFYKSHITSYLSIFLTKATVKYDIRNKPTKPSIPDIQRIIPVG